MRQIENASKESSYQAIFHSLRGGRVVNSLDTEGSGSKDPLGDSSTETALVSSSSSVDGKSGVALDNSSSLVVTAVTESSV